MHRRSFLAVIGGGFPTVLAGCSAQADQVGSPPGDTTATFEVVKTDAEWRRLLTPEQFHILRESGTERAGSSPLDGEHRTGVFHCAGCNLPVYASAAKYDSGTGWPSFTAPLPDAVATSIDRSLFAVRTEVHCRRCGGHLGHIFDDGPPPTGQRHCLNGAALRFAPKESAP